MNPEFWNTLLQPNEEEYEEKKKEREKSKKRVKKMGGGMLGINENYNISV